MRVLEDAGVVHEDVDAAELGHRLRDHGLDLRRVDNVGLETDRPLACRLGNRCGRLRGTVPVGVREGHIGTVVCEPMTDAGAVTSSPTCDQRHPSSQKSHAYLLTDVATSLGVAASAARRGATSRPRIRRSRTRS